jgi:hypothetical protein
LVEQPERSSDALLEQDSERVENGALAATVAEAAWEQQGAAIGLRS